MHLSIEMFFILLSIEPSSYIEEKNFVHTSKNVMPLAILISTQFGSYGQSYKIDHPK
jgi:hypothetical protein